MVCAWGQQRRSRVENGSRSARYVAATHGQLPMEWSARMLMKSRPKPISLVAASTIRSACTQRRARSNTGCQSGPVRIPGAATSGGELGRRLLSATTASTMVRFDNASFASPQSRREVLLRGSRALPSLTPGTRTNRLQCPRRRHHYHYQGA